jgi:hypothetical protein
MLTVSQRKTVRVHPLWCWLIGRCAVYGLLNFRVLRRGRLICRSRHNTMHIHEYTNTAVYVRSVPETPCLTIQIRSTHSGTILACSPAYNSGAPDSSWILQGLATMPQSVRKSYHSRLQRCCLDTGKNQTFIFSHVIQITESIISLS